MLLPRFVPTTDPRLRHNPYVMTAAGAPGDSLPPLIARATVRAQASSVTPTAAPPSAGAVRRGAAGRGSPTRVETGRVAVPRPTLQNTAPISTNRSRGMAYGAAYAAAARVRSGRGY
jgi:hypothetical protein